MNSNDEDLKLDQDGGSIVLLDTKDSFSITDYLKNNNLLPMVVNAQNELEVDKCFEPSDFLRLFNNKDVSDIILKVGEQKIYCNSVS